MRRASAAVVMWLAVDPVALAGPCHHFSVWHYRYPQRCRLTALAPAARLPRARIDIAPSISKSASEEIPLPSLADIEWAPAPDEYMLGRLLLRVIMEGRDNK